MFEDGDVMINVIAIIVGVGFVIVIGIILLTIIMKIVIWNKNNHSPKLAVNARVIAKKTAIHGGGEHRAYSDYFVTFEVDNGNRLELEVKDREFGMLIEGDVGELTLQGTRYLSFVRKNKMSSAGGNPSLEV